jgi:asparagine synthase (glutamine-hydrolysing)
MCGFAGELRFDGRPAELSSVEKMSGHLQHRGPDGCGVWQRGPLALAHRRLTIIDLSCTGEQPMVDSELGLSIVFNGCLYNYRELRSELETAGYQFFSTSDTDRSSFSFSVIL